MIKREDVIFNPTDPRVEGLIGKKVFFGDKFSRIQKQEYTGVLTNVVEKSDFPFRNNELVYAFIAPVPEPKYRPFKSAEEFAPFRDKWVIEKSSRRRMKIFQYEENGAVIFNSLSGWKILFEYMTFEDGTPFGVKENN